MPKTTRFDAADYLNTEERQVAYIAAALESGDADFVRDALGLVARARGMGEIAKKAAAKACTRRSGRPAIPNSVRSCALFAPLVSRSRPALRPADRRRSAAESPEQCWGRQVRRARRRAKSDETSRIFSDGKTNGMADHRSPDPSLRPAKNDCLYHRRHSLKISTRDGVLAVAADSVPNPGSLAPVPL